MLQVPDVRSRAPVPACMRAMVCALDGLCACVVVFALLVDDAAAVHVAELQLELDVSLEDLVRVHHTDRTAEDCTRTIEVLLSHLTCST